MADDNKNPNAEGNDDNKNNDQNSDKGKVVFSPEQQAKLDSLIDATYTKAWSKAEEKLKAQFESKLTESQTQIQQLSQQLEEVKKAKPAGDKNDDKDGKDDKKDQKHEPSAELLQLRAQLEELNTSVKTLKTERQEALDRLSQLQSAGRETTLKEKFLKAAEGIEFFDPMEAFSLVRNELEMDEHGNVTVMNRETGRAKLNAHADPMTLREYVHDFADRKKYLVRASDAEGGTGAGGSKKVDTKSEKPGDMPDFSKMSLEQIEAYSNELKSKAYER